MAPRPVPTQNTARGQGRIIRFAQLADHVRRSVPRIGPTRLICVDGRSGAGKTMFAARLSAALGDCQVIHADDLYPGWHGLESFGERLRTWVLAPLSRGEPAGYRRYDWPTERYAERHPVPPADTLIVEGVGAAERETAPMTVLTIWLDAPRALRYRRGIDRDGDAFRPYWELWAEQEQRYLAAHAPRDRADLIVDGAPPSETAYDPETELVLRRVRRWPDQPPA